jgi:D-sedoheptulose 7-phosphate isomerase
MMSATQLIDQFEAESLPVKSHFFGEVGFRKGRKVLLFGNGDSAADALHTAAEFVDRFISDEPPLPGLSLPTDTSVLKPLENDYGYAKVFSRQIEFTGVTGEMGVAIFTGGNSRSVFEAIDAVRLKSLFRIGSTGESAGKMNDRVDVLFRASRCMTPPIQETHLLLGHILCGLVDGSLFPDLYRKN